jgi:predicted transcriptional regulator
MAREIEETPPPDLGELEHEILRLVWERGFITAEQCREALGRPLKESTVRTVLRRLEEKNFVRHSVEGRTFLYEAVTRPNQVAARAVQRIVDRFCGGSVEQLLVGLVDGDVVDGKELERLAKKIAQAKAKGAGR